jgi:predicted aldo/keto reductase-like oxidoreductase
MAELSKRALGRTGVEVTTLGFGAMELRGPPDGPPVTDEAVEPLPNQALDAGVNFNVGGRKVQPKEIAAVINRETRTR